MTTTENYSEYSVCVGNDPVNYTGGTRYLSREMAREIASRLQALIDDRFPGIRVLRTEETGAPTPTRGPDQSVIDEINAWIAENWTAAL